MNHGQLRILDSTITSDTRFALLIVASGYERRSAHVARRLASVSADVWAYGYPSKGLFAHAENRAFLSETGRVTEADTATQFSVALVADLERYLGAPERDETRTHIGIDVSSFSREWLGIVVRTVYECASQHPLKVTFLYSPADFDSHKASPQATVMVNGPLNGFAGWTADPSRPVACVLGLGFESLVALAALETLEPARTVGFVAESLDDRFLTRVRDDNAVLLGSDEVALTMYDIGQPFASLQALEGVVHGLTPEFRVVLVPLGPKIFALLALLVALQYEDDVAVWRVSAGPSTIAEDRVPVGPIVALAVELG